MRHSIRTMLCLALFATLTSGCASAVRTLVPELVPVERPEPPTVLMQGCPAPPAMPPLSSFPANDARPLVAVMTEQVDAGDRCRIVVDGWKAWDTCMRLRAKNSEAACPVLESIIKQLGPPDLPAPKPML